MNNNISKTIELLLSYKNSTITILTGAGVSAESGIPTFRGNQGLWKNYNPMELATPEAFLKNPKLVWEFYDWRRVKIKNSSPNSAHKIISEWENIFPNFYLITQNVDGLHQRAGSKKIIELHGNIWKVICTREKTYHFNYDAPLKEIPPRCKDCGAVLRPGVVWFGEQLPQDAMNKAFKLAEESKIIIVAGTSSIVYPAALLPLMVKQNGGKIVEINLEKTQLTKYSDVFIKGKVGEIFGLLNREIKSSL